MKLINFSWEKIGKLFLINKKNWSHSSHPCLRKIKNNYYEIYFASRDKFQKSHIYKIHLRFNNQKFSIIGSEKKVLSPGNPGHFDSEGCIPVDIVHKNKNDYLIYVGWQNFKNNIWICDTGIAKINKYGLKRVFNGPIIGRCKESPLFTALTTVVKEKNSFSSFS